MPSKPSSRLIGFESIRGIAAIMVFLFHFYGLSKISDLGALSFAEVLFKAGHVGLDIFFVLSGFLIFRSLYLHGVNFTYFQRRFLRIVPLYYFSLLICLVLLHPETFSSATGLQDILAHVFFVHSFFPSTYYGINPVLWSLSIEMMFYLFLPLFFLLSRQSVRRIVILSVAMIIGSYFYRYGITGWYSGLSASLKIIFTENFFGRADQFAWGMLASLLVLRIPGKSFNKVLSVGVLTLGIAGVGSGMAVFAQYGGTFRDVLSLQLFLHSWVGFSVALFLLGLAFAPEYIKKFMGNPVFEFLGMISYSFYIWHFVLLEPIISCQLPLGTALLVSFLGILALSSLTYFLVERPFLIRKKY